MQNLIGSVNGGTLYHAFGECKVRMIDIRDIADFAAKVLAELQAHTAGPSHGRAQQASR